MIDAQSFEDVLQASEHGLATVQAAPPKPDRGLFDSLDDRIERDAFRLDALLGHLQAATDGKRVAHFTALALDQLHLLATQGVVPRIDPAGGRAAANLLTQLRELLLAACPGALDEDEAALGLSAAVSLCRTFGRSWQDLKSVIGTDLMLDRIDAAQFLYHLLMCIALRQSSLTRGEPHRRGMAVVSAANPTAGPRHV